MKSLMTFAAAFLMRPVGALVLGAYTDRHGRRAGLILTLALMAVGIATPDLHAALCCDRAGGARCWCCWAGCCRVSPPGVELGSVSVYLAEIAPPGRKGFYVSWQSGSQQVAVVTAALIGVATEHFVSPAAMGSWGWRIPLLVGCLIVPLLFLLRRHLPETEAFQTSHAASLGEVVGEMVKAWPVVLVGHDAGGDDDGELLHHHRLHSDLRRARIAPVCDDGAGGDAVRGRLQPGLAAGDRAHCRTGSGGGRCSSPAHWGCWPTAYPAMVWLTQAPSFGRLLAVELWLSFLYASYRTTAPWWSI